MRYGVLALALVVSACGGDSPAAPARTYTANLTVDQFAVTQCGETRCLWTAVVTNRGPDCANRVSVSVAMTVPPLNVPMAIGASLSTVLRPNTSATVSGDDWPRRLDERAEAFIAGTGVACP